MTSFNGGTITLSHTGILFNRFGEHRSRHGHICHTSTLIYVYSGELIVVEGGQRSVSRAGQSIFIKADPTIIVYQSEYGGDPFRGIFIEFESSFLAAFYRDLDRSKLPDFESRFPCSVVPIPHTVPMRSFLDSVIPYLRCKQTPCDGLLSLKMYEAVYILLDADERFYSALFREDRDFSSCCNTVN